MSAETAAEVAKGAAENLRKYLAVEWDADTLAEWVEAHGEDVEPGADAYDWASSALDVKRTYGSDGELCAVELLVGFGGPNLWATFDGQGCEFRATWYSAPAIEWVGCDVFSTEMLEVFDTWSIDR